MLNKKQSTVLIVIFVLIFAGTFVWFLSQKPNIPAGGESPSGAEIKKEETPESYSLSGVISSVDVENNFLMVKSASQEKEIKVILSDATSLIKLEFPFDPKNPPEGGTFTPKMTQITVKDLKAGDNLLVESTVNIYGKDEFDNVSRIQVLP